MTLYLLTFILFAIGLYGVLVKKNLIKMVVSLAIMEYAVNLFFVLIGYRKGASFPVLSPNEVVGSMVDPLPQALILTAIVIGLAVTALMVSIAVRIYEKYDIKKQVIISNLTERPLY